MTYEQFISQLKSHYGSRNAEGMVEVAAQYWPSLKDHLTNQQKMDVDALMSWAYMVLPWERVKEIGKKVREGHAAAQTGGEVK